MLGMFLPQYDAHIHESAPLHAPQTGSVTVTNGTVLTQFGMKATQAGRKMYIKHCAQCSFIIGVNIHFCHKHKIELLALN